MDLHLEGKAAAITGGSEGIGRAIAEALMREGCDVAIGARRTDVLERTAAELAAGHTARVVPIRTDVTDASSAAAFIDEAAAAFGRLDILVNNAGRSAAHRFDEADEQAWDEDLQLKLYGAIRCTRSALPHLRAAGGGSVVNITTVGGKQPGAASVPTSVSRAAGIALTKALSKDYVADNIRVNTVMVGSIRSMQTVRRWEADPGNLSLDDYYEREGQRLPMGRYGRAEEVADVVAFLVSPRASYVTGRPWPWTAAPAAPFSSPGPRRGRGPR